MLVCCTQQDRLKFRLLRFVSMLLPLYESVSPPPSSSSAPVVPEWALLVRLGLHHIMLARVDDENRRFERT